MGNKGKLIFTLIAVLAIAAMGAGAMTLAGGNSPDNAFDLSGNCDEAEHATDPDCLGGATPQAPSPSASPSDEATDDPNDDDSLEAGEDISGPCDEAEHANDPRCTGQDVEDADDDDADDDDANEIEDDDDEDEDNSGPSANSGPGSENSGHDSDD